MTPRAGAALIALICWAGLGLQLFATYSNLHDLAASLWIVARFFTILTNLLLAVTMTMVAIGRRVSPGILGGLTLAILLVGIVYATLLAGVHRLTGPAWIADLLLHKASPVLAALYWVWLVPHGRLSWRAPLRWAAYPLCYFAYVLARGASDGKYPYPFLDVGHIGWGQTAINAVAIAIAFIPAGFILVWLDRDLLGRGARLSKAAP